MRILFGIVKHFEDPKIRKMPERSLCGNRELHFLFWSMIHLVMKFTLSVSEI